MEPPPNLHARRTQLNDEELDPQVAQLGQECGKLYAILEVRTIHVQETDWQGLTPAPPPAGLSV